MYTLINLETKSLVRVLCFFPCEFVGMSCTDFATVFHPISFCCLELTLTVVISYLCYTQKRISCLIRVKILENVFLESKYCRVIVVRNG